MLKIYKKFASAKKYLETNNPQPVYIDGKDLTGWAQASNLVSDKIINEFTAVNTSGAWKRHFILTELPSGEFGVYYVDEKSARRGLSTVHNLFTTFADAVADYGKLLTTYKQAIDWQIL